MGRGKNISKGKRKTTLVTDVDASTDEDDLDLPLEEEGVIRMRFKSVRGDHFNNSNFKVGMVFESIVELRKTVIKYSVNEWTLII